MTFSLWTEQSISLCAIGVHNSGNSHNARDGINCWVLQITSDYARWRVRASEVLQIHYYWCWDGSVTPVPDRHDRAPVSFCQNRYTEENNVITHIRKLYMPHTIYALSVIRSRMLPPFIVDAKDKHPTFILSIIRSRMLPPFISDAKDKHPTFIFSVIRSRMLPPFISDAKDKHPTFILSVIRSRMLPPFISDAKDKHPTFIFSVIRSRMLPPFISDAKDKTRHLF